MQGIICVAVVVNLWVGNGTGFTIGECKSLVEVGAVLKSCNISSDVLGRSLMECILWVAVVMDFWIWDGPGLSVDKGEPLIEVWAMFETRDV